MEKILSNSMLIGKLKMPRSPRIYTYILVILSTFAISLVYGQVPTCDNSNGGCSDICTPLSASGGVICSCSDNKTLANNNRVCVPPDTKVCDGSTQFTCANGEKCIPLIQACDITDDCGDESDEGTNYCYDHKCGVDQFTCDNGKCIYEQFKCDFYNDCFDNSDENPDICGFVTCSPGSFACANGICISNSSLCNGIDECLDGMASDELGCPDRTCSPGTVPCENSNICISPQWLCDKSNDCGDNSDEDSSFCSNRTCSVEDFLCQSGKCIPGAWFCDGRSDCPDGDDEVEDVCTAPNFTCHYGLFTCDDGTCITEEWECDGIPECPDGSDEYRSCPEYVCPENFYKCEQKKHLKNRCIPDTAVCDGQVDCAMGDDEFQNCTMRTCMPGEYSCRNGLCIRDEFLCDHENDCGDQSDEGSACNYSRCDPETEFTCNNGLCVMASWVCDGVSDCRDRSDEHGCDENTPTCAPGEYMCGDGSCILQQLVCNNDPDCNDGLDEYRCGVNECENNATGCHHNCVNTANSYYCTCDDGFRLNADGRTCDEINECVETPGICSQICENTVGGYICMCVDGYTLRNDRSSCKHNSAIDPLIIFSNVYYIRSLSLDGREYNLIADDFGSAVAFDYDYAESRLYVMDIVRGHILRMWVNGTDREVIINDFVNGGEGMSVDWVGRKLYWVDSVNDVMEVAELDGSQRKTLVYTGMDQPRAVVVNPKHGHVYWTDWGLDAYIGRVGMDGTGKTRFHDNRMVFPNGLTIDYAAERLYWCDAHLNHVAFSDLDGNTLHIVPTRGTPLAHPFAISLFEDDVYITDWNEKMIRRFDKLGGRHIMEYVETLQLPMDIHIYHPLRQDQTLVNPCGSNNGGCSHMCLIAPGGQTFTCACPDSFVLDQDGVTCLADCSSSQFACANQEKCIPLSWRCDTEKDCSDGSDEPVDCPTRYCPDRTFQCDDTACVPSTEICNGEGNCLDGSDEAHCNTTVCQPWEFRCGTGSCINHVLACNGVDNCPDGSDEVQDVCAQRGCSEGYFQCGTGYCIPQTWVCDLDNDCGDASDEPLRECQTRATCPSGWFSCVSNYRCVPSWAVCNGYDDCRDNSDEEQCATATCEVGEFQCVNGDCIPQRWVCDFENDCTDGSDEQTCTFRQCSESEFRCTSNKCIPQRFVCDFEEDCPGGDDEVACPERMCYFPSQFKCASGHCIDESFVCDGTSQCQDSSDEIDCPTRLPQGLYCYPNQFTCDDTVCLPLSWRCDGTNDCPDGSDETLSLCSSIPCDPEERWRCDNGFCIPRSGLCDGVDTCGDASDENDHELCEEVRQCTSDEFKCVNQNCIPQENVCDLQDDCGDMSDEYGCYDSGSCSEDNGGCQEVCIPLTLGYYCSCADGHQLADDRSGCEDIDECLDNPCQQQCSNTKGSYECSCSEGYQDDGVFLRGQYCKAIGARPQFFFGEDDEVRYFDDETKNYGVLLTTQGIVRSLDYNFDEGVVYWIDPAIPALMRAYIPNIDETAVPDELPLLNIYRPQNLAVDWFGGNLYWTDLGEETDEGDDNNSKRKKRDGLHPSLSISTATLDGRYRRVLVEDGIEMPVALAVNPRRGVFYWSDIGALPKIEMVWMNGNGRQILVDTTIEMPTGLAIDFANRDTVYWCDQSRNAIESMNWDGSNRKILRAASTLSRPRNLDVFENSIFFTTAALGTEGEIRRLDKLGRGVSVTEIPNINEPSGLKLYQEQRYNLDVVNRCEDSPCSHLCFLIPVSDGSTRTRGYACGCPDGDSFQTGSTTRCRSATMEPRPLPDPIPNCPCLNGGVCLDDGTCECRDGWTGENCAAQALKQKGLNAGATAGIAVGCAILVLILAIIVFLIIRRRTGIVKTPKREGHVTYRTGTNVELPFQSHDTPDHAAFENPIFANGNRNVEENIYMNDEELAAEGYYDPNTGLEKPPLTGGPDDAVYLPEKMGVPEGGIDASAIPPPPDDLPPPPPELQISVEVGMNGQARMVPLPEMDLMTPPTSPTFSPTEGEGDRNTLVFQDEDE
ncbi:low-density lipoprotein receptor-related protein 2-like [Lytechinus variegatus]|uniref:low-density lipoprotein receptor-related protein 2-like n=1 Tax=Lytechinus variegatus TaxID=7654 RepID=UPI001BB2499B|nr:low-density lipoprotein receptor-related protein 2-like [Lytechinus variegatus]